MANFYCIVHKREEDTKELWGEITYPKSPIILFMSTGVCKASIEAETSDKIISLLSASKVVDKTIIAKEVLE